MRHEIASRIVRLRESRGLNQTALAKAVGFSCASMSLNESGQTDFRLSTLEKVAEAMRIDVRYLVASSGDGAERPAIAAAIAAISGRLPW